MSTAVPTQSFGYGFAAAGTVFHAALVIALFVIMIGFVPNAKKTFDEFGLTLPWLTLTMIRVSGRIRSMSACCADWRIGVSVRYRRTCIRNQITTRCAVPPKNGESPTTWSI